MLYVPQAIGQGRPHRNKNDQVIGIQAIPLSKPKELSVLTIGRWKLIFFSLRPTQVIRVQAIPLIGPLHDRYFISILMQLNPFTSRTPFAIAI